MLATTVFSDCSKNCLVCCYFRRSACRAEYDEQFSAASAEQLIKMLNSKRNHKGNRLKKKEAERIKYYLFGWYGITYPF